MTEHDKKWQERRLEDILKSNLGAGAKIRSIVQIGFNETMARVFVAQAEASYSNVAYYERIGPLVRSR